MTEQTTSTPMTQDVNARRPRTGMVAVWLSSVAVMLSLLLVVPYMAQRSPVTLLILTLAAAAGVAGIILGLRARRSTPARGGRALICALAALLTTVVLTVIFVVGMISATSINKVELRGQGPEGMSATFANDMETRTEQWPAEGWARFNTNGSWAALTLEASDDAPSETVSCQIIWNGEVVVDETSEHGSVTCRYDAG